MHRPAAASKTASWWRRLPILPPRLPGDDVQPAKAQELPILPPWMPGDDDGKEESPSPASVEESPFPSSVDDDGEEESPSPASVEESPFPSSVDDDGEEESPSPPSIKESPFPSSVDVRPDDDDDDGDLPLSLYVSVENEQHRLCDASSCYKDLSNISFEEVAVTVNDPAKRCTFPVILHWIVSGGTARHLNLIRWLPHGRAFEIVDAGKFFAHVAPRYFYSPDPAVMFMELAEAYGFQVIGYWDYYFGTERIVIYHERFLKFRPWIAYTMEPGRSHGRGKGGSSRRVHVDQIQKVLWHLDQLPALEDVMVPLSALIGHQALAQHQPPFAVAHADAPRPPPHAFIPVPPFFDWNSAAHREGQPWDW